ncbi:MAG: peptidoglycan-binding domain-containing protein [Pseudomonadota bacterium]
MQTALSALGYDVDRPDGLYGPRTASAIKTWQQDNGQAATGDLSDEQAESIVESIKKTAKSSLDHNLARCEGGNAKACAGIADIYGLAEKYEDALPFYEISL